VIDGIRISMQIGLELRALKKLQSFLVAAEVACSKGDFPVAAVVARLAAVAGYAAAAEPAAAPAELTAALPLVPRAAIGAKQPFKKKGVDKSKSQARKLGFLRKAE
jgi:hypothetical protein